MTTGTFEKARRETMWIVGLQLAVTLLAAGVAALAGGPGPALADPAHWLRRAGAELARRLCPGLQ